MLVQINWKWNKVFFNKFATKNIECLDLVKNDYGKVIFFVGKNFYYKSFLKLINYKKVLSISYYSINVSNTVMFF